jgi:hypothetical protein
MSVNGLEVFASTENARHLFITMKTPAHIAIPAAILAAPHSAFSAPGYQEDLAFLRSHTGIVELSSGDARVAVAPAYQGRVMTSTADGTAAFGWINPDVISTGIKPEAERTDLARHIHVFGGEERLWFGPEGGPFALFFPPKVPQTFANWKTPPVIDTEVFEVVGQATQTSVTFAKNFQLPNRAGTQFSMEAKRSVSLVPQDNLTEICGVKAVAYTTTNTTNTIRNSGTNAWTKETGAPSIWLLGMYKPTPGTTIVVPFLPGSVEKLGPKANTAYFGKIPDNRIAFTESALFFKGDGNERGKLGIPPKRSKGIAGSWQSDSGTLTLVKISPPSDKSGASWPYVDSQWKEDVDPFGGDVMNSYNDGPPEPGAKPLGPFYELESSSPALFLKPGESYTHTQTTIHMTGPRESLDAIARHNLGVGLDAIEKALP